MMGDTSSFAFTISLAAVINGLGIVRLLSALAEYLRGQEKMDVRQNWIYSLLLLFQFLTHVLLWWAMFGTRVAGPLNFPSYLYLLLGPIFLFLATSVLLPDTGDDAGDLFSQYLGLARAYFGVLIFLWVWVIFLWPVLVGVFAPAVPMFVIFLGLAIALRLSQNLRVHSILVPVYCALLIVFIGLFQMQIGGVGKEIVEGLSQ